MISLSGLRRYRLPAFSRLPKCSMLPKFSTLSIFIGGIGLMISGQIFAGEMLSLDAALQEVLENNRAYRVSEIEAKSASEQVSWGRAGALPKVDITASQTRSLIDSRQERAGSIVENKTGAKSTNTVAGILGTWTVFEGLSSMAAHDRLNSVAEVILERRNQMRQDIAAQLILAYVDVVRQQRVLVALDSTVSFSQERVKITEGKYKFGSLSKLELLQAKLDLNEDLSSRLKQVALLSNTRLSLNRILARMDTTRIIVEDSIVLSPVPAFSGLHTVALETSPELRQASLGKNLASAAFREYRGHLFPQLGLSLGYNYGLNESEAGFIRSNEALGWNYGVNLKWNIFDGLVLPDDYRTSKIAERRADLVYEDAKARLETTLAQAQENHRASLEVVELEQANLGLARENVGIAMERLRLGTIASLELRAAQEKYVGAETRLVTARFESKRAETELLRLAGRLAP
jgi:outer membrane protein